MPAQRPRGRLLGRGHCNLSHYTLRSAGSDIITASGTAAMGIRVRALLPDRENLGAAWRGWGQGHYRHTSRGFLLRRGCMRLGVVLPAGLARAE